MSEPNAQLEHIEQLLREGNALRSEAIALQREALALQKSLVDEQRANLAQAAKVNEQALLIQKRARGITTLAIPLLVGLIVYVSYLLFFRAYP